MSKVRIIAKDPAIDITVEMGDGPATITAGLGGWGQVERVEDIALTDWQGQPPLQQDIPLLLDGFAEEESVERDLNAILKLGRDASGDEHVPPVFRVWGAIYYPGKAWVLPDGGIDLSTDGAIRRTSDGELLRQFLTLHLLEYVRPDVVRLRNKRKHSRPRVDQNVAVGGTYTTHNGDTLIKIAAKLFRDWTRWTELSRKNGINDPHRVLPAGRRLRV